MARLIVLGMLLLALIPLARDERTWRFFGGSEVTSQKRVRDTLKKKDKESVTQASAIEPPAAAQSAPEERSPEERAPEEGVKSSGDANVASTSEGEPGPTDLDPLEREAALEEFQAVSDRSLGMRPEEMGVYWRMFAWTKSQTYAEMNRRAKARERRLAFNDFVMSPDVHRGEIVSLKLNLRRVLEMDAPANPYGIEKVYELWGWAEESQGWLYCVLASELPPDMPIGARIEETAYVTGYFFKLQGYFEVGAGPRDKPLAAPLLIGRVRWQGAPSGNKQTAQSDWKWLWWIGGLAIVYLALRLTLPRLFRGKGATPAVAAPRRTGAGWVEDDEDRGNLANWLSDAQSGELGKKPGKDLHDVQIVNESAPNYVKPPPASNGHGAYPFGDSSFGASPYDNGNHSDN